MGTNENERILSWTLSTPCRVSGLVLKTIIGHVSTQYHVVFDEKISTVEHMRRGTVPVNWKNFIEEHSDIATQ